MAYEVEISVCLGPCYELEHTLTLAAQNVSDAIAEVRGMKFLNPGGDEDVDELMLRVVDEDGDTVHVEFVSVEYVDQQEIQK